ncbi:hypothetical protein HBB16_07970 [Pseudonocardia sp. MCCB 268]|nr:hypothetical protein [Pseudonocardia cytotoxica]
MTVRPGPHAGRPRCRIRAGTRPGTLDRPPAAGAPPDELREAVAARRSPRSPCPRTSRPGSARSLPRSFAGSAHPGPDRTSPRQGLRATGTSRSCGGCNASALPDLAPPGAGVVLTAAAVVGASSRSRCWRPELRACTGRRHGLDALARRGRRGRAADGAAVDPDRVRVCLTTA